MFEVPKIQHGNEVSQKSLLILMTFSSCLNATSTTGEGSTSTKIATFAEQNFCFSATKNFRAQKPFLFTSLVFHGQSNLEISKKKKILLNFVSPECQIRPFTQKSN